MPHYSASLMKHSLISGGLMAIIFSPLIISFFASSLLQTNFTNFIFSLTGGIFVTVVGLAYMALRKSLLCLSLSQKDYGIISQVLHLLALGSNSVAEMSFDLDQNLIGSKRPDIGLKQHVFVAGLARSGTTILMRHIYSSNSFVSLTYRDMPFILAPNFWRLFSKYSNRNSEQRERAHGDGIKIDSQSPEALEEVFWRVFCQESYVRKDTLVSMQADKQVIGKFVRYIEAVLHESKSKSHRRYLSKNNNNILRLPSILEAFPNAIAIIPFRSPLKQANSLLTQHARFSERSKNNTFELSYMNWLVHHEFGGNHKRFQFEGFSPTFNNEFTLDYWLELWIHVYRHLIQNAPPNAIFLSYDMLCENGNLVARLNSHLNINFETDGKVEFKSSTNPINLIPNESLLRHATMLCDELTQKCLDFEQNTSCRTQDKGIA